VAVPPEVGLRWNVSGADFGEAEGHTVNCGEDNQEESALESIL
jgi:hypothetical protein